MPSVAVPVDPRTHGTSRAVLRMWFSSRYAGRKLCDHPERQCISFTDRDETRGIRLALSRL